LVDQREQQPGVGRVNAVLVGQNAHLYHEWQAGECA
jgi:hypothetical protein